MTSPERRSRFVTLFALALGAGIAYFCSYAFERVTTPAVILSQILDRVERYHLTPLEPDELEDLAHVGFDRMLKKLDRHSGYIPPKRVEEFEEDTEGYIVGIGVVLAPPPAADAYPQIAAVIRGGPAERAGLISGDEIRSVEDEDVRGVIVPDLRDKIKGKPDSSVRLGILRGESTALDLVVTRQRVETSSISSVRLYSDGDEPVAGYLRLDQFQMKSAAEVAEATRNLVEAGARGLIIDFRDNGGGLLDQARELAQLFLPAKSTIVSTRGRDNFDDPKFLVSQEAGPFETLPLVVLIDGGSASASELVAGALRDHSRAVLVGEESFGKWTVQNIIALGSGGADGRLKLTTKGFYPPRSEIRRDEEGQTLGLLPDIEIAIDRGMLRELLRLWHDERMKRVNDPLAIDRLPLPTYDASHADGEFIDTAVVRAIALFANSGDYATYLEQARSRLPTED